MARVLVTRPEPGATATARRLAAMGHDPIVLPLSRTERLAADFPEPDTVDAVAATSANALRLAAPQALMPFAAMPLFAVGERTGAAARRVGFGDVRVAGGDGALLVRSIEQACPRGARVLYPCGRVRRATIEAGLAGAGFRVTAVEIYDTRAVVPGSGELEAALAAGGPDYALAYSAAGARALAELSRRTDVAGVFERTLFLCLSPAVASALDGVAANRVVVSREPNQDALLLLIGAG